MPVIKLSLRDAYYEQLRVLAAEQGVSMQDYIRNQLFHETMAFTPAEAVKKALQTYHSGDIFTLPELYGKEWTIQRGSAGPFGRQFNKYVLAYHTDQIRCLGKQKNRHARYMIL